MREQLKDKDIGNGTYLAAQTYYLRDIAISLRFLSRDAEQRQDGEDRMEEDLLSRTPEPDLLP